MNLLLANTLQSETESSKLVLLVILVVFVVAWLLISQKAKKQKKNKHIITDWPDGGFGPGTGHD
jgi:preprotein translocase subunit YajC